MGYKNTRMQGMISFNVFIGFSFVLHISLFSTAYIFKADNQLEGESLMVYKVHLVTPAPSYTVGSKGSNRAGAKKKFPSKVKKDITHKKTKKDMVTPSRGKKAKDVALRRKGGSMVKSIQNGNKENEAGRKRIKELELQKRHHLQALKSIRDDIGEGIRGEGGDSGSGEGTTMQDSFTGSRLLMNVRFRAYYDLLWQRIRSKWILPENIPDCEQLKTDINVFLARDGRILEEEIISPSGNLYFDRSALRALAKSDPLPPLPDGYRDDTLEVGFRFVCSQY